MIGPLLICLLFFPCAAWSGPPAKAKEDEKPKAASKAVDIVFVVDATGSMETHIKHLRESALKLAKQLESSKMDARYAATIYRDRVDKVGNKPEDPFALKVGGAEFTKKIELLTKALAEVKAENGGDFPESAFDAMDFASKLPFRKDARKVLILLTDAPPRAPDKDVKDETQLATRLNERGIDQLHVFHDLEPERYKNLQSQLRGAKGRAVALFPGGLDSMERAMLDIGRDVAGIEPAVIAKGKPGSSKIDVVIVLDTTGSMDLTAVRGSVDRLFRKFDDKKIDARIGLVTFKDRTSDAVDQQAMLFEGSEFTRRSDVMVKGMADLKPDGGGDLPESGFDALEYSSRRSFRPDAHRVLLLITDAPPRSPDKDMKDERVTAAALRKNGIHQLHMIVKEGPRLYEEVQKLVDKDAGITLNLDRALGYPRMLDDIGDAILARSGPAVPKVEVAVEPKKDPPPKVEGLKGKLDVVFVLDVTGSMETHLRNLRDSVGKVAQVLTAAKTDFRMGVVTFTDRVDEPAPNNEHKALKFADGSEFSRDADEVSREIGKLNAFGGGDAPESGFDALEFASRRDFRKDARNVLILLTDDGPRVPDKEMRDEDQVGALLKERRIASLHLLVGTNFDRYARLAKMLPREGKLVELNRLFGGGGFHGALEEIAKDSASDGAIVAGGKMAIAGTKVDLVFLMDTTGSMSDFAGALTRPAERILGKLQDEKVDVRFSLITFRDRHPGDGNVPEDHKVILLNGREYSTKLEELRAGIATLRADQGGDAPESSLDALAFAAKRDFRFDALKVLVLITDEGPKVPDKEMKDENDVLKVFKDKGIHQLHLITANNAERYLTIQRLMGKDGKIAGRTAKVNDRAGAQFLPDVDQMSVAILDQLRTEGRVRLSDKPLPPLKLARNKTGQGMIDVVFVLDVTASMGPEINLVRDNAPKILKKLSDLNLDVRFGLTYFRDRVDKIGNVPEDPKSLLFGGEEFTKSILDFQREVGALNARDGGDLEESSLDALEYASRRSFRKGAYKVLVLITDAPPRIPDKNMKDEMQLGELLRERGIHQLHLLLKSDSHRYVTLQRFLSSDGAPFGTQFDLGAIGRGERNVNRLMDSISRYIASEARRGLARMTKGGGG